MIGVIPGCATWRRPGIHTHDGGYGFRAHRFAMPRNDVEKKFSFGINAIPPVQSCRKKEIASRFPQIKSITVAIPSRERGVSRSSRTLVRDAVDAAASG